jgi:hypothetical protein
VAAPALHRTLDVKWHRNVQKAKQRVINIRVSVSSFAISINSRFVCNPQYCVCLKAMTCMTCVNWTVHVASSYLENTERRNDHFSSTVFLGEMGKRKNGNLTFLQLYVLIQAIRFSPIVDALVLAECTAMCFLPCLADFSFVHEMHSISSLRRWTLRLEISYGSSAAKPSPKSMTRGQEPLGCKYDSVIRY